MPIYWGNPDIASEFNPDSFINCHDYNDFNQVVSRVAQIDSDDELYLQIVNKPCFSEGRIPYNLSEHAILSFFRGIFEQNPEKARRRPLYGTTLTYEKDMKLSAAVIEKRDYLKQICNSIIRR